MFPADSRFLLRSSRHRPAAPVVYAVAFFSAALLSLPGCSERRAAPVDADLARTTLTEVLEHWKQHGSPGELRKRSPEIVVQDDDWSGKRELQEYTLLSDGLAQEANLFCDVELTLAPVGKGEPTQKTVTYIVGTDPVLTVFRAVP